MRVRQSFSLLFLFSLLVILLIDSTHSQSYCTAQFRQQFLQRHNELRARHGAAPLRFSMDLDAWAQDWANNLASSGMLYHRAQGLNQLGENIFTKLGPYNIQTSGLEPVDTWYAEAARYYNLYGYEPLDPSTSHFTQLVWRSSNELGVGCAQAAGKWIVVANYRPYGNVVGSYAQNVQRPYY